MKRPVLLMIVFLAAGLGAAAGFAFRDRRRTGEGPNQNETAARDHVEISEEKFAAANIAIQAAELRDLQSHRIVRGHIKYNERLHVEIKSPFDGLIRQIEVKVGDRVHKGQLLAIVDSPELGDKRADVLLRESDLEQAKSEYDRWHSIQLNLDDLLLRLKSDQAIADLEKDFADKPLGDYRQQIFSAYSQMQFDQKWQTRLAKAVSGDIPERDKNRLEDARNKSTANYQSVCDVSKFDVKQRQLKAEATMKDAERRLVVAKQRLGVLVDQSENTLPDNVDKESLSQWPVKAPFAGTVEEIILPSKERVLMSQGLFQLADTSHLWVEAEIRERDWQALSITPSQPIFVQSSAFNDKTFEAKVAFVGRAVATETRAVPLIAEIDNKDGQFLPGMSVRILIPEGQPRKCLALPQSAIASNDNRTFVFIEAGPREYHPRDVTTGISVEPWIEITSGVQPGELVVISGTAILKAELLLESDE